ncbi:MAG: TlyA family RNA methyltransferase [candidate division WOR-3 bacterium]|nr:TlyA family RNA methyltransferase [candidate division WOR-3 bacterium]MCX7947194.1 TlyA family RNA methyltransferase [candidate division WOR-3 bacterium]MDW8150250.1 TlyA family RNA methyltransferase [candidate division WOR-3 bacterium]
MKVRIDQLLVIKNIAESREKAKALIMSGNVIVNGKVVDKPGRLVDINSNILVKEKLKYVSRGGYKLETALKEFQLSVENFICLDIGSSTGGFVDCLIKHGAKLVYAIDVGKNQLHESLRKNEKVISYEKKDARELSEKEIPQKVDLITIDVSFISLTKIIPNVIKFLKTNGYLLVLVKPQFELSKKFVKEGVVKDETLRMQAVEKISKFIKELNFEIINTCKSYPLGSKGNQEYFILSKMSS